MQPGDRSPRADRKRSAQGARSRGATGPATPIASRPRRSRREYAWIAVSIVVALVMVLPFFGGGLP